MEPKAGKQIVSKGAYAKQIAIKSVLLFLGATANIVMFVCLKNLLRLWLLRPKGIPVSIGFVLVCAVAFMLMVYGFTVVGVIRGVRSINPGVPLTRANTADLPAPESLVRASEEPMQAQEAVLLRAVAEGQETPPEQLVRAVNGRE